MNYGPYNNQRLYFDQQDPSFTPILSGSETSEEGQIVPSQFINLTNQQLMTTYQMSFGGALLPSSATTATNIVGGKIDDATNNPMNVPVCIDYNDADMYLKTTNFPDILDCIDSQSNLVDMALTTFPHPSPCSILSVPDFTNVDLDEVSLFPNPFTNTFTVDAELETFSMRIYALDGKLVHSVEDASGTTVVKMNGVNPGMYIVQILDNRTQNSGSFKIVKHL
ncbi:MAG: T9SS type A sorting domain-containing protein [Bacteroidota bacterium]